MCPVSIQTLHFQLFRLLLFPCPSLPCHSLLVFCSIHVEGREKCSTGVSSNCLASAQISLAACPLATQLWRWSSIISTKYALPEPVSGTTPWYFLLRGRTLLFSITLLTHADGPRRQVETVNAEKSLFPLVDGAPAAASGLQSTMFV